MLFDAQRAAQVTTSDKTYIEMGYSNDYLLVGFWPFLKALVRDVMPAGLHYKYALNLLQKCAKTVGIIS